MSAEIMLKLAMDQVTDIRKDLANLTGDVRAHIEGAIRDRERMIIDRQEMLEYRREERNRREQERKDRIEADRQQIATMTKMIKGLSGMQGRLDAMAAAANKSSVQVNTGDRTDIQGSVHGDVAQTIKKEKT